MKVDTHGLLLAAALFGTPAFACRGGHAESPPLVPDLPAAADRQDVTAKPEVDLSKSTWSTETR